MEQNMNISSMPGSKPNNGSVVSLHRELTRSASRLLSALQEPGASAWPDPRDGGALLVRRGGPGVSLGGGRFPPEAGADLVAADLATRTPSGHLVITAPGRARLRREAGGEVDPFRVQHLEVVRGRRAGEPLRDGAESPWPGWPDAATGTGGR